MPMLAALALGLALNAQAAPSTPPAPAAVAVLPGAAPASLPSAVQFDMDSKITGRTYRIYVAKPLAAPPPGGYPVITVLDGDTAFATAASQSLLRSVSGGRSALVVGVAYPKTLATMVLRLRDLTDAPPLDAAADPSLPKTADAYGGAEDFHRFLIEELRPLIAASYRTDAANQALAGHSLGGLFALQVLFRHPEAYRTIVAASPSIWWRDREVLKLEPAFSARVRAGAITPRVLITVGGLEQDPDSYGLPVGPGREALVQSIREAKMVDNARALAGRLGALKGAAGYQSRFTVFDGESHNTVIPAATSRALTFALEP